MQPYFEKMDDLGKPLKPAQIEKMAENRAQIEAVLEGSGSRGRTGQKRRAAGGKDPESGER